MLGEKQLHNPIVRLLQRRRLLANSPASRCEGSPHSQEESAGAFPAALDAPPDRREALGES